MIPYDRRYRKKQIASSVPVPYVPVPYVTYLKSTIREKKKMVLRNVRTVLVLLSENIVFIDY